VDKSAQGHCWNSIRENIPDANLQLSEECFKAGESEVLIPPLQTLQAGIADAGLAGELRKGQITSLISEKGCELMFERSPRHRARMMISLNHMWFFWIDAPVIQDRWGRYERCRN